MTTQVQIDGIGTVELDDSFKSMSADQQNSVINDIAAQRSPNGKAPAAAAPAVTAQPSLLDRAVASPPGRLLHDAVVQPAIEAASFLPKLFHDAMPSIGTAMDISNAVTPLILPKITGKPSTQPPLPAQDIPGQAFNQLVNAPYQAALARNRNTPGYAQARQQADATMRARGGSGFGDQITSAANPSIAGAVGLFGSGSFDQANANADAQTAGQDDYRAQHPILAIAGNALGASAAAPEVAPELMSAVRNGPWLPPKLPPALPQVTQDAAAYAGRLAQSAGKTPADLAAADPSKPVTAAEVIGKPGTTGLAALARRDGTTGDMLQGLLDERQAGAPGRVMDDYASASGIDPNAAQGNLDALVASGRQKAGPLYDAAYAQPPVITDRLQQFAQEPIVQQGMKEGIKTEKLNALASGQPFDPNAYAVTSFDANGDPTIGAVPTWKSWDAAKVGLDDMLNQYRNPNTGRLVLDKRGDAINNVRKAMLTELDTANPAYGAARAQAGDYLSAQSAFQRGQNSIMNPNMTVAQFNRSLAASSPAELEALKGGVANKLFNLAQNGRLDPKVFNRPIVQQKLTALLGDGPATTLLANVKAEANMAANAQRMRPGNGSPTAELHAAMADQDGSGGAMGFGADVAGGMATGRGFVRSTLDAAGKRFVLPMIDRARTPGMPQPVRNEAGRLLAGSPADLASVLLKAGPLPQKPLAVPRLTLQSAPPYGLFGAGLGNSRQNQ